MVYEEGADILTKLGFVDVVLPFVIVFTFLFAVLEKTKVLDKRRTNIIVSVSITFFVVLAANLLNLVHVLIRNFVIVLLLGFLILVIVGLTGATPGKKSGIFWLLVAMFFGAIILAFVEVGLLTERTFMTIVLPFAVISGIVGVVLYVLRSGKEVSVDEEPGEETPPQPRERPRKRPNRRGPTREEFENLLPEEQDELMRQSEQQLNAWARLPDEEKKRLPPQVQELLRSTGRM